MGIVVWKIVEFEADDAPAAAGMLQTMAASFTLVCGAGLLG
jgi:hypothetical protein